MVPTPNEGSAMTVRRMIRPTLVAKTTPIRNPRLVDLEPHAIHYRRRKRILDVVGAGMLLLALFPLFLVVALVIKLTSKGPVFYVSTRVGLCGRVFPFYKFRSMYVDAEQRLAQLQAQNEKDGPIFKIKNDPRVTPFGHFMRKYSVDELPQLINVLLGDMSLVGPRPPLTKEVEQYDEYEMERLSVRPGLTCFWQIMGRSELSFGQWMDLDHKYIREMSLWTDVKILLITPFAVLKGRGAY